MIVSSSSCPFQSIGPTSKCPFFVVYLFLGKKKQETDDGQPVVGAFRPQDLALLLLQRRHATDRLAPAAQLRHHSAGQITGKEMHEEKKFCFFFVLFFSDFQFNRVLQHAKPLGLIMPSFTFPSSFSSLSCAFYRSA